MTGANPVMVVRRQTRYADGTPVGRGCWLWCPACDMAHRPQIVGEDGDMPEGPCWEWDGNLEAPTFSPSLLVYGSAPATDGALRGNCHSFVRAGRWEFLGDCAHGLAGQTVDMVPLPDWLVSDWFVREDEP